MLQPPAERTVDPLTTILVLETPIHKELVSLETQPRRILRPPVNLRANLPDTSEEFDEYLYPVQVPRRSLRTEAQHKTVLMNEYWKLLDNIVDKRL